MCSCTVQAVIRPSSINMNVINISIASYIYVRAINCSNNKLFNYKLLYNSIWLKIYDNKFKSQHAVPQVVKEEN